MASSHDAQELLELLKNTVESLLIENSISADLAEKAGDLLIERLAHQWGGTVIYFPMWVKEIHINKRNKNIFDDFNGGNVKELCRKYNLSEVTIYKIIKNFREAKTIK